MRSMFQTACSDRKVQRKSLKIREEFIPLKSLGGNTVPVRPRSPAPIPENLSIYKGFRAFVLYEMRVKNRLNYFSKREHPSKLRKNILKQYPGMDCVMSFRD